MESDDGGRRKKLIRALETAEFHGRPICSQCTEQKKNERGCKKPGEDRKLRGSPFRWTSPALQGSGDLIMYECPVGYILRTTPHVFDVLNAAAFSENASPSEYIGMTLYMQQAIKVYGSEKARLFDLKELRRKAESDARVGARAVAR